MARLAMACVCALVVGAIGCSSADGQAAQEAPGTMRARSLTGADLGFAYDMEISWPFQVVGGTGTANLVMVLVKEQPAGAARPMLVWRSVLSGAATLCARYYDGAACAGSVTHQPTQAGAACVAGGRMYRPDLTAAPAAITFQSAELPRWDPAALAFVHECLDAPGTTAPIMLPAVDAGPAAASPGRIYVEPAD
jgi:hypothetical protein